MDIEYLEDKNKDDFIKYIFSSSPKSENYIKLELGEPPENINIKVFIFYELLQILIDGLFYLKSSEDKLNINDLSFDDIELIKKYFLSFGFQLNINIFTIETYKIKQPNLLQNKEYISDKTELKELFHEIVDLDDNDKVNKVFRIEFDYNVKI